MRSKLCRNVARLLAIVVFIAFALCFAAGLHQAHGTFDQPGPNAITADQVAFGVPAWGGTKPAPDNY
jgi:hypothetical protein